MRSAICLLLLAGCLAPPVAPPAPTTPVVAEPEEPRLGPQADTYQTAAQPKGVVGGRLAERIAAQVVEALRARGAEPEADGTLAVTAAWFLEETMAGRTHASADGQLVARRRGLAGNLVAMATAGVEGPQSELWRKSLAQVPINVPVNRYGVRASAAGVVAVAFGSVEARLAPIPRHASPGRTLHLTGEIGTRFDHALAYLTGVDGKVQELRQPSRQVDATFKLAGPGVYQAEVMGDGATGPVVLVNVPIYVGVPEPELGRGPSAGAAAVDAEPRLLALLNAARKRAGLGPLAADAELRAVALAHDEDMIRAHFMGHVSPTTGTPEDRIKRAGVHLAAGGENIARAATVDEAHDDLMSSPGHRANMLSPRFTHVGIAVVTDGDQILATLVFGRRFDAAAAPFTAREAIDAIATLRRSKGLPPVQEDPVLRAAAAAGIKAFAKGGPNAAFAETNAVVAHETAKRQASRPAGCVRLFEIVDPDQLGELPMVLERRLRKIGVGVASRTEKSETLLEVLIVGEGVSCDK
jgi:uncharacterized protein YkwD